MEVFGPNPVASALEAGHPAATTFVAERFASIRAGLVERIRVRQQHGRIRADIDADHVAALLLAASDGLQIQWLLDPNVDQVGALALLDRLLHGAPARLSDPSGRSDDDRKHEGSEPPTTVPAPR